MLERLSRFSVFSHISIFNNIQLIKFLNQLASIKTLQALKTLLIMQVYGLAKLGMNEPSILPTTKPSPRQRHIRPAIHILHIIQKAKKKHLRSQTERERERELNGKLDKCYTNC